MDEKYYKTSCINGEKYNIFDKDFITIKNIRQASYYMLRGVKIWDCYPSIDSYTNNPVVTFVFKREDTKEIYNDWLNSKNQKRDNQKQDNKNERNGGDTL